MALVRPLRGGQVTLPAELRQKLRLAQGDYLEVQVVDNGVPAPRPTHEEEEEWLAEEVVTARREEHVMRRR